MKHLLTKLLFSILMGMVPAAGSGNISEPFSLTVGTMLNAQAQFQLRYATTLNPNADQGELEADMFQFNLNYFW